MERQNQKHKKKLKKEGGVTLVALVVTIIVLLILAGVALNALFGDSGILNNAEKAKEETLKANLKEKVQLAIMEYKIGQYSEEKTLKEYLEEAGATEVTEAGTKGKMDGYNFEIQDGVVTISKSTTEVKGDLKLKDVYTEEMIGQTINYTTTNVLPSDVEWRIIGQDEEGNVLATTNRPLGMVEGEASYAYNLTSEAASWLSYEDNLNTHCGNLFGGTVQGETIEAYSMNMDHVNALTGFEEPEFNTYTFTDQEENDYENKIVNYYHPDATSENNWSKATTTYDSDAYYYYLNGEDVFYSYEGTDWEEEEYTGTLDNLELILGENNEYTYVLASRSVDVDSDGAYFCVGIVGEGFVGSYGNFLCLADSSSFNDYGISEALPVRPVVSLSSEFTVEEQDDGTYKLAE